MFRNVPVCAKNDNTFAAIIYLDSVSNKSSQTFSPIVAALTAPSDTGLKWNNTVHETDTEPQQ